MLPGVSPPRASRHTMARTEIYFLVAATKRVAVVAGVSVILKNVFVNLLLNFRMNIPFVAANVGTVKSNWLLKD